MADDIKKEEELDVLPSTACGDGREEEAVPARSTGEEDEKDERKTPNEEEFEGRSVEQTPNGQEEEVEKADLSDCDASATATELIVDNNALHDVSAKTEESDEKSEEELCVEQARADHQGVRMDAQDDFYDGAVVVEDDDEARIQESLSAQLQRHAQEAQRLAQEAQRHAQEFQAGINKLGEAANRMRISSIEQAFAANWNDPTGGCSAAEIVATLFFAHMRYIVDDPCNAYADRFGNGFPLLSAAWEEAGHIQVGAMQGEPMERLTNIVDVVFGSAGQMLWNAIGMASSYNMTATSYRVYCLLGAEECAEDESVWKAAAWASRATNLVAIVNVSRSGQSEAVELARRFKSCNWNVAVVDGHSIAALLQAYENATNTDKPSAIVCKTHTLHGIEDVTSKEHMLRSLRRRLTTLDRVNWSIPRPVGATQLDHEIARIAPPQYSMATGNMSTFCAYRSASLKLRQANKRVVTLAGLYGFPSIVPLAVGMSSRKRLLPHVSGLAACFTRASEELRMAALSKANIKCAGTHCGVSMAANGAPNLVVLNDLALFRALHGSVVVCPSDAVAAERATELLANYEGISYQRVSELETPVIYANDVEFMLGEFKVIRWNITGDHILLISAGLTLHECLKAHDMLHYASVHASVIDLFSVKPIDVPMLKYEAERAGRKVLTVEDHYAEGGINEAVCAALADLSEIRIRGLCVTGLPRSGSPEALLDFYGISANSIVKEAKKIVSREALLFRGYNGAQLHGPAPLLDCEDVCSFTIKELRELLGLPGLHAHCVIPTEMHVRLEMERPRQRLLKLMLDNANSNHHEEDNKNDGKRMLQLHFHRRPQVVQTDGGGRVRALSVQNGLDGSVEDFPCGLLIYAIGFEHVHLPGVPTREDGKLAMSDWCRVVSETKAMIYATGWCSHEARGLIADSQQQAYAVADQLADDWSSSERQIGIVQDAGGDSDRMATTKMEQLLRERNVPFISWEDWRYIDQCERRMGAILGKSREKITDPIGLNSMSESAQNSSGTSDKLTVFGGCEGPEACYVKLVSSDGHEFVIHKEHALISKTIRAMLSGPGQYAENETNEVHFREIPSHVLQKVCHYFAYKARYTNSATEIPEFYVAPEEIKLLVPNSRRINRGEHDIKHIVEACKANAVGDLAWGGQVDAMDDEYRWAGCDDPNIVVTTSRDPSSRLKVFAKEIKLLVPNSRRINRGEHDIKHIVEACKANAVTDLVMLGETRGVPDSMIVSHFPHGPTAYFSLHNVLMRHDSKNKKEHMTEQYPHLIFHEMASPGHNWAQGPCTRRQRGPGLIDRRRSAFLQAVQQWKCPERVANFERLCFQLQLLPRLTTYLPNHLDERDWHSLLAMRSTKERCEHLTFLVKRHKMKAKTAQQKQLFKERKRAEKEEEDGKEAEEDEEEAGSSSGIESKDVAIRIPFINNVQRTAASHRYIRSLQLAETPRIAIDCRFLPLHSVRGLNLTMRQLRMLLSENRDRRSPWPIHFVNFPSPAADNDDDDGTVQAQRRKHLEILDSPWSITGEATSASYLELFPALHTAQKIVYLSPHSKESLTCVDADACYVIGAIVDRAREPRIPLKASLAVSEEEALPCRRLPIPSEFLRGGNPMLTLVQVLAILQHVFDSPNGADWRGAFEKHIPLRKQMSPAEKNPFMRLRYANIHARNRDVLRIVEERTTAATSVDRGVSFFGRRH
uniref:Elongin-C n=1 Tax=Globodera pallida TaxID=36090 RepID=A0A183C1B1_GLOPA